MDKQFIWHSFRRRSLFRIGSLVVLLALLAAACGSDDGNESTAASDTTATSSASGAGDDDTDFAALEEAAKEEGSVLWYTVTTDDHDEAVIAAFNEKYPDIKVEFVRQPGGDLQARLDADLASGSPVADLLFTGDGVYARERIAAGDTVPMIGPTFESDEIASLLSEDDHLVTVQLVGYGIAWNTDNVTEPMESYEDLLRPELKGRIGMLDLTSNIIVEYYMRLEEALGADFMEGLAAQEPRIYPSSATTIQGVSAGEVDATALITSALPNLAAERGEPVGSAFPEPNLAATIVGVVLESAPHPNAAQLFMNFLMSREGQEAYSRFEVSPLADIESAVGAAEDWTALDPAAVDAKEIEDYRARWTELFG